MDRAPNLVGKGMALAGVIRHEYWCVYITLSCTYQANKVGTKSMDFAKDKS